MRPWARNHVSNRVTRSERRFASAASAAALGNVIAQVDPLGRRTSYAYDALYRLTQTTDAAGGLLTYVYDAAGNPIASVDQRGHRTTFVYDALNRAVEVRDAAGGIATTVYDKASNITASVDELGNRTSYVYDGLNRVVAVQDALGNFATTVYDKASNVLAMVDPLGHRTSYSYDALHRQVTATDAVGNVVTTVYDKASNVVAVTGPRGFTTSFAYDALHRRVQTENALGDLSTVVYDQVGNAVAFVDELGRRTTSSYDALNRLEARTDALDHTTTYVYDAAGNPTRMIDPLGFATSYAYDALNRRVSVQDPGGGIATTVYDPASNVVNTIDPVGNKTTYVYDALNRQVETLDAEGGVTTLLYDAAGNVRAVVDPVGNRTTFAYDALHREIEREDPLGNSVTMAYDAAGRMTSRIDRLGRRRDFSYDDANRLTGETWLNAGGGTDQLQTYTYDAAGNRLTAQDPDGAYTFSYDALNRVATQQGPFGLGLTFGYDAVSNRTKVEDSKGGVTTSTYNAVNLLLRRDFGGSGQTPLRFDQTYTARDQLESVTRYSDLAGMNKVGATSYAYDAAGRVSNIHHRDGAGASLLNLTYTYDLANRVTSETEDGATKTFTYDATDQLTGDGTATYGYDPAGNRDMTGYQTGAGNRLLNDGTYTYTHDAEGNRTKKSKGVNDETWTYGYDHRNQLTWIEKRATDGGTLELRLEFKYDSFNRRIEESRWTSTTGTVVTRFGFDGINPWAELDGSNALTMRRLFGDGVDELVARVSGAGVAGWYKRDRLGSVRLNVSASGVVLNRNTFSGFGQLLGQTNPSASDAYQYTGKAYQGDSGIQWNLHRWYDTRTGRWLTVDPWHFGAGDYNLYRYVGNSPTNAIDPTGQYLVAKDGHEDGVLGWIRGNGIRAWARKLPTEFFWETPRWYIYIHPEDHWKFRRLVGGEGPRSWRENVLDAVVRRPEFYHLEMDADGTIREYNLYQSERNTIRNFTAKKNAKLRPPVAMNRSIGALPKKPRRLEEHQASQRARQERVNRDARMIAEHLLADPCMTGWKPYVNYNKDWGDVVDLGRLAPGASTVINTGERISGKNWAWGYDLSQEELAARENMIILDLFLFSMAKGLGSKGGAPGRTAPRGAVPALGNLDSAGAFAGSVDDLVSELRTSAGQLSGGGRRQLEQIANRLESLRDTVHLLDEATFEATAIRFGENPSARAMYRNANIYLRRSQGENILVDAVHEGTHAVDFAPRGRFAGIDPATMSGDEVFLREYRAFMAEKRLTGQIPFGSHQALIDHIMRHYPANRP